MRFNKIAIFGALSAFSLSVATTTKADAAYVVYLYQDGADVVATGSGSLDLPGSPFLPNVTLPALIGPGSGTVIIGSFGSLADFATYAPVTGPTFGSQPVTDATTSSGNLVGISARGNGFDVPRGYVSGTPLGTSTATWGSTTLTALGVIDGTYTWTLGAGPDADSFTLNIGTAPPGTGIPEPASMALLGTGLVALASRRGRQRSG